MPGRSHADSHACIHASSTALYALFFVIVHALALPVVKIDDKYQGKWATRLTRPH